MYYCENGHWLGEDYGYPYCPTCGAEIPRIPTMLLKHCVMCVKV